MNLLVVGNGFDLAHDLPTRYSDFLDFMTSYISRNCQNWQYWGKFFHIVQIFLRYCLTSVQRDFERGHLYEKIPQSIIVRQNISDPPCKNEHHHRKHI